jgi:hypothetical protein
MRRERIWQTCAANNSLTRFAFRKYFRLNDKAKQITKHAPDREFGLAMKEEQELRANATGADCAGCITWRDQHHHISSRPSRYTRRGADRKGSLLVPTARLEVHLLADGSAIAHSPRIRSLHNTSSTLNLSHGYLSHLNNVTFDWLAPYPASLKRSTLGSNRDRKTAASIGSSKQ